jgi:polyferredoxin
MEQPLPGLAAVAVPIPGSAERDIWERIGDWLLRHQRTIRNVQWGVVAIYFSLLVLPVWLPPPGRDAHLWTDAVLFARFVFWGIWWPFVLLATALVGRAWCGLLCPEGALSEFASRHGRARAIPRWVMWAGWPFAGFVMLTTYGQMISVYQYPEPALVLLGGSTVAAVGVGASYGRGKRVWCRFLCPVSGVFGLLAKLAPLHFRVDPAAWSTSQRSAGRLPRINCAPLVPIRTMQGASLCHMCGRCSGFRGAVRLTRRSPEREIVEVAGAAPNPWETALIVFGLMGIAAGAFRWATSPTFVAVKQAVAAWLVERGTIWPLERTAPWWILTNRPDERDVLTLLDGALIVAYMLATALAVGLVVSACLALAARVLGPFSWTRVHHLAQSLVPAAGCSVFVGLSALTVSMLRQDGFAVGWADPARAVLLAAASAWSLRLAWLIGRRHAGSRMRAALAASCIAAALLVSNAGWIARFV